MDLDKDKQKLLEKLSIVAEENGKQLEAWLGSEKYQFELDSICKGLGISNRIVIESQWD